MIFLLRQKKIIKLDFSNSLKMSAISRNHCAQKIAERDKNFIQFGNDFLDKNLPQIVCKTKMYDLSH